MMSTHKRKVLFSVIFLLFVTTGCATSKALRSQVEEQSRVIANLNTTIEQLNFQLEELCKPKEALLETKIELEHKLKKELSQRDLKVYLQERGLIIIVSNKILFDPGQVLIKPQAKEGLNKIAEIINKTCPNNLISVEGYTDNKPIKYSTKYPSNWELSACRATEVVRYLIKQGVSPERLSAVGYGEYRPIDTNDTPQGRANNRRVEIVISPKTLPSFVEPKKEEEK
ncbi:MAG: hypothetical protein B5M48_00345 [Candidatus Omnitrophica bacterium 4484_213]|nr:MAG: hypothetical protein B5M48_00345 [Candidatus Omnitrophica bacterium 4484_213]